MSKQRPVAPPPPPPEGERPHRRRRGGRMFAGLLIRLLLLLIVVAALALGWNYYKEQNFKGIISHDTGLTDTVVMEKLKEIGQLVTYSYEYSDQREIKDSRQIFGWNIPGTTHTIQLKYNGIIKVGYEVADIQISVDNESKTIYVTLPEPKITDNYIDMDNLSYAEQNNIFNPISGDEITGSLDTIKAEALERAEHAGIYELAKGNAKSQISGLFEAFEGYSVKFVD